MHVIAIQSVVGGSCIAENVRTTLDVFTHHALKRLALRVRNVPQANLFRLTIQQAHHDCFTGPARARDFGLFVLVHVSGEAADKRFINLELAGTLLKAAALHRKPDAMIHEPRRFLRHF
jgi:hypothetical protein